jgi:hypothetical protein
MWHMALQPHLPKSRQIQLMARVQGCSPRISGGLHQNCNPNCWKTALKSMPHVYFPGLAMWPQQPGCYLGLQSCSMGSNIHLCYTPHGLGKACYCCRWAAFELSELLLLRQAFAQYKCQDTPMQQLHELIRGRNKLDMVC